MAGSQSSDLSPLPAHRKLRWRLPFLVVVLVAIALAAFVWAAYRQLESTLVDAGAARARSAAAVIVNIVGPAQQQRAVDMKRAASAEVLRRLLDDAPQADRAAAENVLRRLQGAGRQITELWDANGVRVLALAQPADTDSVFPPSPRPSTASFLLSHSPGGLVVVDLAEPVRSDGRTIGYLVVRRPVTTSSPEVLNRLVGDDARIRLGSGGAWTDLVSIVAPSPLEAGERADSGEYLSTEGHRRIAAVADVPGTPFFVSVDFPRAAFMGPARAFVFRSAAVATIIILIVGLVSWIATSRITTPLAALTDASDAIATGDFGRRVDAHRHDEMGRLGMAFNSMVSQIQEAHERTVTQARQAAFIADIGVALNEGGEMRAVLSRCAEAMVRHLDAGLARIWTVAVAEPVLELQAVARAGIAADNTPPRLSLHDSGPGRVALERKAFIDTSADRERYRAEGVDGIPDLVSYAGLPLVVADKVVGVVSMFGRKPITDDTVRSLEIAARTIASAIERYRQDESRSRLESLLESAPDFVTIGQLDGPPLYINRAAREAFGIGRTEVIPSLLGFRPPDQQKFFRETVVPAALRDGLWRGRTSYISRSGQVIPVSQVSIAHSSPDGRIQFLSTISRDITEELRAAEEREALEEQLRRAQKIEAIGQLAGGLAHDFNNLLTIIIGYANVLSDDLKANDPLKEEVEQIQRAGNRAAQLTRQLLAFSRRQVLSPVVLDPNTLIGDIDPMLRRLLGESIELAVQCDPAVSAITFDPAQFELILVNLIVNARDAMPNGGRVIIDTADVQLDEEFCRKHLSVTPGHYVRISVTDTGVGIDNETMKRIFEPFFTTKSRDKGTGLGLATVFGIVKQSGGSVWVYSEPGLGASFKIFLPATGGATMDRRPRLTDEAPAGSETVLVVEDEPGVRLLTEAVLKRAGYTVALAGHPSEALRLAGDPGRQIDLLITDVVMPEMNGAALARELCATRPSLRVLFMSGFADDAIEHHGIAAASFSFLQKPFTGLELARKVRDVLDRASPGFNVDGSPS